MPTASVVAGLAALAVHDPGRHAADDVVAMTEAAAGTRSGALQVAEAAALTWAGPCAPGDVLGLVDGEVVLIAPDIPVGALWLASRMLTAGGELVTVLLGDGVADALGARAGGGAAPVASGGRRRRAPRGTAGSPAGAGGGMTSTQTVDLDTPLAGLVGKKAADALSTKLGLHTVGDLVRHYPRRYVDRGKLTEIAGLELGEHVTVLAEVEKVTMRDMRHRRGKLMQVVITDGRGRRLDCTFFNPYKLQKVMVPGLRALFSGQVSRFRDKLQLTHPEFEPLEESEGVRPFISIYPATQGFDSWQIARCVRQVLELLDDPTDPLPASLRRAEGLSDLGRALRRIHLPETEADQYAAKNRLVWDEAMGVQLALALRRSGPCSGRRRRARTSPAACSTRSTRGCPTR